MKTGISILTMGLTMAGFISCSARPPENIGIHDNRLNPCPSSPNCVSSYEEEEQHGIKPFTFSGDPDKALNMLKNIVLKKPRTLLIRETGTYMHFTFKSMLLRFIDDVEFLLDAEKKLIHVRSASRTGYSDMGVNRKRIEAIRRDFQKE